eukprot:357163-Chlamydomonas_euryale.AAC.1
MSRHMRLDKHSCLHATTQQKQQRRHQQETPSAAAPSAPHQTQQQHFTSASVAPKNCGRGGRHQKRCQPACQPDSQPTGHMAVREEKTRQPEQP